VANIWFHSPQTTSPLTNVGLVFIARVGWTLGAPEAKIQLVASPTPYSIDPNDGTTTTVGEVTAGTDTAADFTVTYPFGTPTPFTCELTAKLFPDGDTGQPPSETASATVIVRADDSGGPDGTGGLGDTGGVSGPAAAAPAAAPASGSRRSRAARGGASPQASAAAAPEAAATPANPRPVIFSGRSTPPDRYHPAAAVMCVIYRMPQGQMVIDYVGNALLLPKDLFAITLDPAVRDVPGRSYRLVWVSEIGEVLAVRSGVIT
jgi:hypothetical protein